jgi:hypothetical protein
MTNKASVELDDRELLSAFEAAAISFGLEFEKGDSKKANRAYARCEAIQAEIHRRGSSMVGCLIELLDAPLPWVQYLAAAYTLDVEPNKAAAVLRKLKDTPMALGVAAFTTLRAWEMKRVQIN